MKRQAADHAAWLSKAELATLDDAFQHDIKDVESEADATFWQMLRDPKAYMLALVYFLLLGATYTMTCSGCRP